MKNKTSRIFHLLSLCCLFIISFNVQSAIIYQADGRYTELSGFSDPSLTVTPDTPFADFYDSRSSTENVGVFQSSVLTSNSMSGTGSTTSAGFDFAQSFFGITFAVDELTNFSLSGYLDAVGSTHRDDQVEFDGRKLWVELLENDIDVFSLEPPKVSGTSIIYPYNYSGQFFTGNTYQLKLFSQNDIGGTGNPDEWQFDLQTASIPVPAAVWLFISGLLGLVGMARHKSYV